MTTSSLDQAAELIAQADGLLIAAGAGMGVDSGLPDFRGDAGFWTAYPALAKARLSFIDVASPSTFRSDPRLAWGFYAHRLKLYRMTVPHEGFSILEKWSRRMPNGSFVFTSNVDGQFQKAGFAEERIHECHGSIHWLQCLEPCTNDVWRADSLDPHIDNDQCRWLSDLPSCPRCGGILRPNILMFGDGAWLGWRSDRQEARLSAWVEKVERPVVVEVGAGSHVPSVRFFTESVIHHHGGRVVRINPRESKVPTSLDVGVPLGALEALAFIDERLEGSST